MIAIIIRTVIIYVFVTFAIRIMGKRQIGDMQPNELVITLLISEIAAIPLQDTNQPILNGAAAIFVLVFLEILVSVLAMKSMFVRKCMSGKSVVVIKNGIIDQQAMRSVRMTVLDLVELLRGQNVFDISTVAYAILEVNGDLSVLLKSSEQTLTCDDMNIDKPKAALELPVISDGKIIKESLTALNISEKDIYKHLSSNNTEIKKVFLMTLNRNGKYSIVKMRDNK